MAYESEWLTRKWRIDNRLKATGWDIVRFSPDILLNWKNCPLRMVRLTMGCLLLDDC
jgi:hypothetical protein